MDSEGEGGGDFGRCSRTGTSRLWMANPEGTQQFRDRDLEFMFYDEAEVIMEYLLLCQSASCTIRTVEVLLLLCYCHCCCCCRLQGSALVK